MDKHEYELLFFPSVKDLRIWLEKHHTIVSGVWIKIAKKSAKIPSVTYDEALDVALCFGWIDGMMKSFDSEYYIQKFTPRRKKSTWSKKNIERVERLVKERKMSPAGMQEIENAKKDGRWEMAYDSPSNSTMPDDFMHLLVKNKKAYTFFKTLNKANVHAISWRLQTAKTSATRLKRMQRILFMLASQEKFH